ncbi:MFS transporter [Neobacillus ginsengisoli]|uniref:MFS family permease n=1 Tax=Neobacillus ginsengisoli TaxID=904295 RepID=A0ABT9XVJ9_9BACI|nr:MFS transporter [Neobacillus ginsengisoli]MDQ0199351.1 MFS family permease [Neobacillus ginsengisoli]
MPNTQTKVPNGRWLHIIPATIIVYIVAFLDRSNISFAIAGGMSKELGMAASVSGLAAGIFFIGYLALQIPGGHAAESGSAKKFIAWTIVFWGLAATLTGFVHSTWQLLTIRFLLGVAEGGVYPAILTIISYWFPEKERARANAAFAMNIAIANIINGPLSGLLIQYAGWRNLFIVEGVISIALLAVWLPLISNRPREAKWITKEELDYIESNLAAEQAAVKALGEVKKVTMKEVFASINVWKLVLVYFLMQVGFYGFSLWLPTLLKNLNTGSGIGMIGFLSIFPYIMCIIGQFIFATLCDKTGNRRLYTSLPILGLAVFLSLAILTRSNVWVSYAFMVLVGTFLQAPSGPFWTLAPSLLPAEIAGTGRGLINALGNLGGFVGPYMVGFLVQYVNQDAGSWSLVLFSVAGALMVFTLPATVNGTHGQKKSAFLDRRSVQQNH